MNYRTLWAVVALAAIAATLLLVTRDAELFQEWGDWLLLLISALRPPDDRDQGVRRPPGEAQAPGEDRDAA